MTKDVPVVSDYRSRRREVRDSLNAALPHRRSYFGFLMGLATTLSIVGFAFAYLASRLDLFAF